MSNALPGEQQDAKPINGSWPFSPPADAAKPDADEAVAALSSVLSAFDQWEDAEEKEQKRDICRAILASIRAGKVPGVYWSDDYLNLQQIAALRPRSPQEIRRNSTLHAR